MGTFVAASAFRTTDVEAVRSAVGAFFGANSWPSESVDLGTPVSTDDVEVYAPSGGWTVVLWPQYFSELAAAEYISTMLAVVASTTSIHDGDYWRQVLLRDGVVLDRFASVPGYFTDDPGETERLSAKYRGNAEVIAETVGCPVDHIAPYLVHLDEGDNANDDQNIEVVEPDLGKAYPDDEFELDNPWVFVDFWRRFGPRYPDDVTSSVARIRIAPGWMKNLPVGDAEL